MQPVFERCAAQLRAHQYAACIEQLRALARTAQTADELLVAARVASAALCYGLELRLVRRAARIDPCPAQVTLYLAATYLERGRYLEAEEILTPWVESESWTPAQRSEALGLLAASYAARRRFRSAAGAIERAARLAAQAGPEAEGELTYIRLSLLAYEHRWEECAEGVSQYLEAHGDDPRPYFLLALCLEHLGRADDLLRTLETACDQFPEHPRLLLQLSSAAWTVGRTDQAEQVLERVAAILPRHRAARMLRRARAMMHEPGKRLPVPPMVQGHNHCFPACLAMVLAYYGRPADQRAVGRAVMKGQSGTPLFRALRYLEQEGWVARTFRATPDRVKALIDRGVPPILGIEWAGGAHVHICVGYDDTWLYIQDPGSFRRRHLRLTGFDEVYAHSDYWALAFVPPESAALLDVLPPEDDAAIRRMQSCWEHLSAGRREEARILFEAIDQGELTLARALFRLRVWPRLGSRTGALAAADWLLAHYPRHRQIRLEVAQHLMHMDEDDRAAAIVREHPGRLQSEALVILGSAARRESLEEARRLFRKAAIADPHSTTPLQCWGQVEGQAGNLERAEALFLAAYEMEPSPGIAADLAHLRHRQGRPAEAVAAFRAVLREEPFYPWAWWMRAEAHWALGQYRAAARCLRIAIAQEPDGAHLVDRLADLYRDTGQLERAVALLRSSPLLATSADLQYSLAVLLGAQHQWPDALAAAQSGMHQFPDDWRFGPFAAEALRMTGRRDEGRALLSRLVRERPDHAYIRARFGRFLLLEGEVDEGIRQIDRALELDPDWKDPLDWALAAAEKLEQPVPLLDYLTSRLTREGDPRRLAELARAWVEHDAPRARQLALAAWGQVSAPAEAIGKVGEVLYLALDLHAALRALREALRRQRVYPWAWWRRSHVHWALGQRRAALRSLRMAVAQDPHSDVLLNELAGRYQELGQAERAVALLQASPLTPGSFDLRHRLVELLLECGRHEDALAAAESALREMGAPGRFGPLAASALVRLGRDEEARALLTRLCEEAEAAGDGLGLGSLAEEWLEHDAAEAVRWGRRAAELLGEDPSDQLAFAHLLLEAGDRDGAEEVLEQLARTSPSAPVFHALSQVAARRSDPDGQVAWLHRAVDAAASPEEVRRYADQLGDVLEERGQTAEITALMNRIEGRVDEAWRRTYLGYAAELTGEYSEAVAHYQAALAIDPLFRWAHFRLPLALLRLEQCDEAIRAAEATVSRWPGDAAMHWLLGRCLLQAGRRDEAASRFRSSLHLDPNAAQPRRGLWEALQDGGPAVLEEQLAGLPAVARAVALWWFGEWWREEGDMESAVAAWKAAAAADPADPDPHIRLAQAALEAGDQEGAWHHGVEALLRDSTLPDLLADLLERTDPATAAAALSAAVERVGDSRRNLRAGLLYLVGECWRKMGRFREAVATWERAVADYPLQRGAAWRLAQVYRTRNACQKVVDLLAPLDEEGRLPTDKEMLLVQYLECALACGRPRRPHWRRLIRERMETVLAQLRSGNLGLTARLNARGELMELGRLYARLEVEFGNPQAARYGNVAEDDLLFAVRLAAFRYRTRRRPPPLDVRPGESTEPAAAGPIGGRTGARNLWNRNLVAPALLLLVVLALWPGTVLPKVLLVLAANVLVLVFLMSLL